MDTKICTKCGVEKPATVEWFSKQKAGKYGLTASCKKCRRKYTKEWQENNKEHRKIYDRKHYENNLEKYKKYSKTYDKAYRENNKEKMKEYQKIYYKNNLEITKNKQKEYRENNKEKLKEYRKQYAKNNSDLFNTHNQTRRAIKKQLPNNLTLKQWQSTKDHFNHECAYCGKQLKNLVQEHVIPLSKGGGYTKGNIIPSCKSCNSSKSASNMKTWYTTQSYFSIERYNKILAFIKQHKSIHDYTPITKEMSD